MLEPESNLQLPPLSETENLGDISPSPVLQEMPADAGSATKVAQGKVSEVDGLPIFRLIKNRLVSVEVQDIQAPHLKPINRTGADGVERQIGWEASDELYPYRKALGHVHGREELIEWCTLALSRCAHNARRRKIEHRLTPEDVVALVNRSGGFCEVTGLPFMIEPRSFARRNPFAPSIDRKDSNGDYSLENCRLVLFCVNAAMNWWGDGVFDTMARAYVIKHSRATGRTKSHPSQLIDFSLAGGHETQ